MNEICTLKELIDILQRIADENPDRLNYKVLVDWCYPDISVQDNEGNEYDRQIRFN
jgi:hypothetical protein